MQDFVPVIGFLGSYVIARFLGYNEQAMYIATAALMATTLLQILWMFWQKKPIENKHWLTLGVILVLGGLTLFIHNDLFIKFKPTVLNIGIAALFLGSQFFGRENLTKKMLHTAFDMPDNLWKRLNLAWVVFFLFEAAVNAVMALTLSNDAYVTFKLFGLMALTIVFMIGQVFFLRQYLRIEKG